MAGIQQRGGSFRLIFRHNGKQFSLPIGKVSTEEAEAKAGQVDYLLLRIKQGLVALPPGVDITEFLLNDGKASTKEIAAAAPKNFTLDQLKERYLASKAGAKEKTTLLTDRIQLGHLVKTLGEKFPLRDLKAADLQRHIDRRKVVKTRAGTIKAATIKKEIDGVRAAWNWAVDMGHLAGLFPSKGLSYPKTDEAPPFMTRAEIEKLPESARDWEALYLTANEVEGLLSEIKEQSAHLWIHPMIATAAYTGMRRSELVRALATDVDFASNVIVVRERKKSKGKRTTRRVPLTPALAAILKAWLETDHPGGVHLFCQPEEVVRSKKRSRTTGHQNGEARATTDKGRMATVRRRERPGILPLTPSESHGHLARTLARTRWAMVRGYHILRHSFISACAIKGVDQRFIDEWVGHATEAQRKRYRHLTPSSQEAAIAGVFG